MATAMAASSPALVTLNTLLGKRPAAARLARGGADYLLGELAADHPASVAVILSSVLVAAVAYFIVQVVISGGVLSALRRPGDPLRVGPTVGPILARGLATAWGMIQLEFSFLFLVRLPLGLLCGGAVLLAGHGKFIDNHTLPEIVWRFAPLAALSLVLWCAGTIVLYATRLQRLAQTAGAGSSLRALGGGIQQSLGSWAALRATLLLAFTEALGLAALVVCGRVLAARLDYVLLVFAALLVRQLFALLRSALTLTIMAGTVELYTVSA
jgi:hypothetical protein